MFQKVVLIEVPRNTLLTGAASFLKMFENFGKCLGNLCYGVSLEQVTNLQITTSSLTLHVFEILENSWDNLCCGVLFYRSRRKQVLCRIAALKSFLVKFQEGLQVYSKRTPPWMFCWEVCRDSRSSYFFKTPMDGCFRKFK